MDKEVGGKIFFAKISIRYGSAFESRSTGIMRFPRMLSFGSPGKDTSRAFEMLKTT